MPVSNGMLNAALCTSAQQTMHASVTARLRGLSGLTEDVDHDGLHLLVRLQDLEGLDDLQAMRGISAAIFSATNAMQHSP